MSCGKYRMAIRDGRRVRLQNFTRVNPTKNRH